MKVSDGDIDAISRAVKHAYHKNLAQDLIKHYDNLSSNGRFSPLTKELERIDKLLDDLTGPELAEEEDEPVS